MIALPQLEAKQLDPKKVAILERLYANLPKIDCQGKCQGCCGPLIVPAFEAERIQAVSGRRLTATTYDNATDFPTCDLLDAEGNCSIYDVRPAICRIWGVAHQMKCPWGCKPSRYMHRRETDLVLKILVDQLGGDIYCSLPGIQSRLDALRGEGVPDNAAIKLLG